MKTRRMAEKLFCNELFTEVTFCHSNLQLNFYNEDSLRPDPFFTTVLSIFGHNFLGDALHKNMSRARKMPLKFLILDLQGCIWAQMKAYKILWLIVLSILNLVYLVEQENSAANGLKT